MRALSNDEQWESFEGVCRWEAYHLDGTTSGGSSRISHLIHGAKLLGAGGGGFLFMVTKGISEARKVKQILTDEPPNDRARFFDFDMDYPPTSYTILRLEIVSTRSRHWSVGALERWSFCPISPVLQRPSALITRAKCLYALNPQICAKG